MFGPAYGPAEERQPAFSSPNVRILPPISERLTVSRSPRPDSAKTYENPARGTVYRKTCDFPARADVAQKTLEAVTIKND
jgi:hypothetical protein